MMHHYCDYFYIANNVSLVYILYFGKTIIGQTFPLNINYLLVFFF